jgi:hypothetical protein
VLAVALTALALGAPRFVGQQGVRETRLRAAA